MILKIMLLLLVILLAALSVPGLFGIKAYAVLSGSMEPSVPVGSEIYVKSIDCAKISAGEVITYQMEGMKLPITHRVVKKDSRRRVFYTKGDANKQADGPEVKWENVQGVVLFSVPFLGYFQEFQGNSYGKTAVSSVLLGLLMVILLLRENPKRREVVEHEV